MAKVLLVEDDNNLREIYQARLMAEGYDIVTAQNGEEALVVAKQNKPDLIISDVMMPRISGFEMLDILRNTTELQHTKVIMLTALGQAEDQKRADNLGADRYLIKSQVTLEDIVNAAKELLADDGSMTTPALQPAAATAEPAATPATVVDAPVAVQPEPALSLPTPAAPPEPAKAAEPAASAPAVAAAEPVTAPSEPAATTPVVGTAVTPEPAPVTPSAPTSAATTTAPDVPASPVPDPVAATPAPAVDPVADEPADTTVDPVEPTATTTDSSASAAATDSAQSIEAEEAALQAQIDNYAAKPADETPAAEAESASESNDDAIAEAVDELNHTTPAEPLQPPSVVHAEAAANAQTTTVIEPQAQPVTEAAPPADDGDDDGQAPQSVAGKRVIQPLNDIKSAPKLEELLAKEAAQAPTPPPTPVVGGTTSGTTSPDDASSPAPQATPGQSFDPNTVAL